MTTEEERKVDPAWPPQSHIYLVLIVFYNLSTTSIPWLSVLEDGSRTDCHVLDGLRAEGVHTLKPLRPMCLV